MMQLKCPCCGMRDEPEFIYGGNAHIARPALDINDQAWGEYLFFKENPKGVHLERWCHAYGCGEWFNVARDTVTHELLAVYRMGESAS